jgi:hypothetical protein
MKALLLSLGGFAQVAGITIGVIALLQVAYDPPLNGHDGAWRIGMALLGLAVPAGIAIAFATLRAAGIPNAWSVELRSLGATALLVAVLAPASLFGAYFARSNHPAQVMIAVLGLVLLGLLGAVAHVRLARRALRVDLHKGARSNE